MRRYFGIPWSAEELRVVDRHARVLVNGEYATAEATLPDCRKALARLRDAERRVPVRTRRAVLTMLIERAHAAGRYSTSWNGVCDNGMRAPNGVLFHTLDAPGIHRVVKVAIVGR